MNALIDVLLVFWLRRGRYGWSRLRRRVFERRYLKTALPRAWSLDEIAACLKQVTWTMDGPLHLFDSISYPQTTWAKRKDDCDGFASLAAELLKRLDDKLEPVLLTAIVRPLRISHTVCAFAGPGGGVVFFDNDTLRGDCAHYREVVTAISQHAGRLLCWDVRRHDSLEMLEFHRA